jgi:hypothetical protein
MLTSTSSSKVPAEVVGLDGPPKVPGRVGGWLLLQPGAGSWRR